MKFGMLASQIAKHLVVLSVWLLLGSVASASAADEAAIARGAYLAAAADCDACHTDKKAGTPPLSGGRAIVTPYGTFYGPNITPDPVTGIGKWTETDFYRAMHEGKDLEGNYLYPVFPYTAFTKMTAGDVADLYAFLMSRQPVDRVSRPHEVKLLLRWRYILIGWRKLFFTPGALTADPKQSAEWNRGRYLAEAVVHCQECHTPRNFLGGLERDHAYAGNPHGPDGNEAPDITADPRDGIGKWQLDDVIEVLKSGMTPDGDYVGQGMSDVVEGTSQLTDADRHAIAVYIKSLAPLPQTAK